MSGFVSLVGAGPGNPELLTVLAKRRLAEADVVVYDRLINSALLMPLTAELINVGKQPEHHRVSQYQINQLLVKLARQGKRVVRLKSGDPDVFGRGGEESQFLHAAGVDFEVVPGITSAIAGLSAAGIPITHREFASSFHVITGHHKAAGCQLDWENIAHQEGTLVFLMGMKELGEITRQLINHGRPKTTPVAVIQWATHWKQRAVRADLATIEAVVNQYGLGAPALIVVGKVVSLMPELALAKPLAGRHLLMPFKESSKLFANLQDQGAAVAFFKRRQNLALAFDWPRVQPGTLVVTSPTAFTFFERRLLAAGYDHRWLSDWRLLAANQLTVKALRARGLSADGLYEPNQLARSVASSVMIGEAADLKRTTDFKGQKIATYRAVAVPQSIEVSQFHGVVFPSSPAVDDLLNGCQPEQITQLADLPCFVMGRRIFEKCLTAGLRRVILVPSQIDKVPAAIEAYFKANASSVRVSCEEINRERSISN